MPGLKRVLETRGCVEGALSQMPVMLKRAVTVVLCCPSQIDPICLLSFRSLAVPQR